MSDIHANFEALLSFEDVFSNVDQVVCLGDIVGYYCQVNEVIEYIRNLNPICIMGNHDYYVLNKVPDAINPAVRFGIEYAQSNITTENRRWLLSLPLVWGGLIGNKKFLFSHGSPWDPIHDYLYENNAKIESLRYFSFDVIAIGQTHRAMKRVMGNLLVLNPGSIGQDREIIGQACAFILETGSMSIEKIVRNYNINKIIDLCKKNGAQDWISKHLI